LLSTGWFQERIQR